MSWHRLPDGLYRGPLVVARLRDPSGDPARFVECWALIDTGATHSVVDTAHICAHLDSRPVDTRRMAVAGPEPRAVPVHELDLEFPDFGIARARMRVSGMQLPGPFWMLIGMDVLDGTRLALECRGEERWLRWESLARG